MTRLPPVSRRRLLLAPIVAAALAACRGAAPAPPAPGQATPASGPGATPADGQRPGPATVASGPSPTTGPSAVAATATADPSVGATATAVARRDRPLKLTLGDRSWPATLGGLGLAGPAPGPTGPAELEALLTRIAPEVEQPARNARLRIGEDGSVELTPSTRGLALDAAASRERILAAAADGRPGAELATRPIDPTLTDAQAADANAQLRKILGRDDGPILTVSGGERSWTLDRAEAAELLALELPKAAGEPIRVTLDEWATKAFVGRLAKALDRAPLEARFALASGKPKLLREGRPGRALDQDAAFGAFRKTLLAADRTLDLPLKPVEPVVGNDPAALGKLDLIESGSTALGGAIPEKRHNVKLAAERLNGTVVAPGGTFSFNREVGPTSLEAGYKWGFGITSGSEGIKTIPSVAGGICQVATTLFQPVFWAGYPLEERYWHLYWIPAYASRGIVGLDVTVDEEARLDFKWINSSKQPVVIQASADDQKITFQLYGKKPDWTVKVDPARITNRVPPDTTPVIEEEPSLPWGRTIQVEAAREGFDAEVVRRVSAPDAAEPRVLTLKSSYQPSRTVTLVGTAGKPAGAAIPAAQPAAQNRPATPASPVAADAPPGDATPPAGAPPAGGPAPGAPAPPTGPTTPAPGAPPAGPAPGAPAPATGATPGPAAPPPAPATPATPAPPASAPPPPPPTAAPAKPAAPSTRPPALSAVPPTVTPAPRR